jgi:mono/diheme cytochrome c family protein
MKALSKPRFTSCTSATAIAIVMAALTGLSSATGRADDNTSSAQAASSAQAESIFVYAGWKVFHQNCYTCHGVDATGSDIAPNLVERIGSMSEEQFATKVLTRYRIVLRGGEVSAEDPSAWREAMMREVREHERGEAGELIMPAWEQKDPAVKPHLLDLYDYLTARAEGRLGPGEPQTP